MRKWHKETTLTAKFMSPHRRNSSKTQTKVDDAELILTPAYSLNRRRCLSGEKMAETNTPIPLSKRFASFGTPEPIDHGDQAQCQNSWYDVQQPSGSQPQFEEETTIPVNDIIKVITRGEDDGKKQKKNTRKRSSSTARKDNSTKEDCRRPPTICITTSASGSYELLMESANEQLVLITFLKVNATKGKVSFVAETDDEHIHSKRDTQPKEKNSKKNNDSDKKSDIVGESSKKNTNDQKGMEGYQSMVIESNPSNLTAQSSGERSFDVEALTAKTMAERLETESMVEKIERRMYRVISSLDDRKWNGAWKCLWHVYYLFYRWQLTVFRHLYLYCSISQFRFDDSFELFHQVCLRMLWGFHCEQHGCC
jgi:hypothetical protein